MKAGTDTFEAVGREWFAKYSPQWAADHADRNIRRLERDVFPWIGSKALASVTALDILAILERIDARGARETAHRARTNIGQVIRYGIATGRATSDPTVALRGAIPPAIERNHAAVTDPDKIGELLRAIDGYNGHFPTRCALQLAPMFFVRPGELRQAEWAEIDLNAAQWRARSWTNTWAFAPITSSTSLRTRYAIRTAAPTTAPHIYPSAAR